MPLTPQDIADTLAAAGVDTPEKFMGFIAKSAALVQRNDLIAARDKVRSDRQAYDQAADQQAQDIQARIDALDKQYGS